MSEKSQEESQSFASFLSLVKKLEGIIHDTPDKIRGKEEEKEEMLKEDISSPEIEIDQITTENELKSVESHTSELEKRTIETIEKEEIKIEKRKIEDLLNIEKELIQLYSGAQVQITDFYYDKEGLSEEKIKHSIRTKLQSLESIVITEKEIFGIPFALCKLEGKYYTNVPLNIEGIKFPTNMKGTNKQLKLIHAGNNGIIELSKKEKEIWNQAINQFQLKLVQIVNKYAKENLSKDQPEDMKMVEVDYLIIQDFIKTYEDKIKSIHNFHNEILEHLTEIKKLLEGNKSIWENKESYDLATANLRTQLQKIQEEQNTINKETQVQYIKLRKAQRQLDIKNKKLKLEEKRKKKVPREEKEELIKQLRMFQKKKEELHQKIQRTKELEKLLEKWLELLSEKNEENANEVFMRNFAKTLKQNIIEILEKQDTEDIAEKITNHQSSIEKITIHVIYIPTTVFSFKAKQGNQEISGKMLYLAPTKESFLLNPTLV